MKKETIIDCLPDSRLTAGTREPSTEEEIKNFGQLEEIGIIGLFTDLKDGHILFQRKNFFGLNNENNEISQYETAIIKYGEDFSSVSILFDGVSATRYEDGSFIRVDLGIEPNKAQLTYGFGDQRINRGAVSSEDLPTELFDILNLRDTLKDIASRRNK